MKNYNPKILAIIPARGGSKGIKNKNIKNLAGKPLIAYTIEAAKKSKYINRIIVSTDDPLIAKISVKYGAEVPYLRPSSLATDSTLTLPVLRNVIMHLREKENYQPDIIVVLQPTSPLRTATTIDMGIETFLKSNVNSLISISKVKENPFWMKIIKNGYLYSFTKTKKNYFQRQKLPKVYIVNGLLYICDRKTLMKIDPFNKEGIIPFETNKNESYDIDNLDDFFKAEKILKKMKNDTNLI